MEDITYEQLLAVIDATKDRIQEVSNEINSIAAQLSDPARMVQMNGYQYQQWKSRAIAARGELIKEAGRLKAKLARYNRAEAQMRQEEADRRRAARIAAMMEEQARRMQQIGKMDDPEVQLIRRLFGALCHLYQVTGAQQTEQDRETIELAHAFLVDQGVFKM